MTSGKLVVFRCDGGPKLGAGHVMRCLAMAEILQSLGWKCSFAVNANTKLKLLDKSPFNQIILANNHMPEDLGDKLSEECALLVVDHYGLDASYEKGCRKWAQKICVFDDLANRSHDCDMLVDFTPNRLPSQYKGITPQKCQFFIGPNYAPLRHEFFTARIHQSRSKKPNTLPHLLITPGATDPTNITGTILKAIRDSQLDINVTATLSADAPHKSEVEELLNTIGGTLLLDCRVMAQIIERADLIIGSGGMSSWERCCLSKPSILIINAKNQRANASALESIGAAKIINTCGKDIEIISAVSTLLENKPELEKMAKKAGEICDGLGANRLALAFDTGLKTRVGKTVQLRPALQSDSDTMLTWQQHPTIRKFARNCAIPNRKQHLKWFMEKLADPYCIFNIVTYNGEPAGVLRFDYLFEKNGFEVSILTAPDFQNLGVASLALAQSRILLRNWDLYAYVKKSNKASMKLFKHSGYINTSDPGWLLAPNNVQQPDL